MSGLFGILNIGRRGLMMQQLALDVTGQNISNATNEAYARKRLEISADYRRDPVFGAQGMGVNVDEIIRVRDKFLDERINSFQSALGEAQIKDDFLTRIENVFHEPSENGLVHSMDQFWDSWQDLANSPSDLAARSVVFENAEFLTATFQKYAINLGDIQTNIDKELEEKAHLINRYSDEVLQLNKQIVTMELNGQNANDARDKRDAVLKDLSLVLNIEVIEDKSGAVNVTVGGNVLVSAVHREDVEVYTASERFRDGSSRKFQDIRFVDNKKALVAQSGQLRGLFDVRDTIVPSFQERLDTLAVAIAKEVNELHRTGYNLNDNTGVSFFADDVTGANNFRVADPIRVDVKNIAAAQGGVIRRIDLAADSTNTSAGFEPQAVGISEQLGFRDSGGTGPFQKTANIVPGSVVISNLSGTVFFQEGAGKDFVIDYENGRITILAGGGMTAGTEYQISFEYNDRGAVGMGDGRQALAIAQLRQAITMDEDVFGNPTTTFHTFYRAFIGKLGVDRDESKGELENQQFVLEQFENRFQEISGVNMDEEMAQMIKFQHGFQAAARVITTTDRMLDILLNI